MEAEVRAALIQICEDGTFEGKTIRKAVLARKKVEQYSKGGETWEEKVDSLSSGFDYRTVLEKMCGVHVDPEARAYYEWEQCYAVVDHLRSIACDDSTGGDVFGVISREEVSGYASDADEECRPYIERMKELQELHDAYERQLFGAFGNVGHVKNYSTTCL